MANRRVPTEKRSVFGRQILTAWLLGLIVGVAALGGLSRRSSAEVPGSHGRVSDASVALAEAATVRVTSRGCNLGVIGSGFAVERPNPAGDGGFLAPVFVTNAHVTNGAYEIKVDSTVAPTLTPVMAQGDAIDVAVASPTGSLVLPMSLRVPEPGEEIVVVGHPGGGQVSHLRTRVHLVSDGSAWGREARVILFEAELAAGYSGGPVIDSTGGVIGISSGYEPTLGFGVAILSADAASWIGENLTNNAKIPSQVDRSCVDYEVGSVPDSMLGD